MTSSYGKNKHLSSVGRKIVKRTACYLVSKVSKIPTSHWGWYLNVIYSIASRTGS